MPTLQQTLHLFNRLFNIRPAEWPRVLLIFLMIGVTNAVAIWGTTLAYAAFLQQVGLAALPWVLFWGAVLSVGAVAVYTAFVDRLPNDRLLAAVYAVGAVCILVGLALLWLNRPGAAYLALYLLDIAWTAVFNAHFVTYVNSFYDTQAAKRILPVVTAGARAGAIIAGLTMSLLTAWLSAGTIILTWLLAYLAMIGLVWLMSFRLRDSRALPPPLSLATEKHVPSYLSNLREGFGYTCQSPYLRWLAAGTLLLMILMALLEYRASQLLLQVYGTPEALAGFLALLVGLGNLVVLPILLLGISRLIARLGLGNASLIFPASNLLICGGLVAAPGLVSAAAGHLNRTTLRVGFQIPIDGLLYNAVPLRIKGRARAFVAGLIVPVGGAVGGLLLLLPLVSTAWFVPGLIGLLAVVYMVSAVVIRRQYTAALVKMLEQEDYSFLFSTDASPLTTADPATLNKLRQKLEESTTPELKAFMAQLIAQMGGQRALPILEQAAAKAAGGRERAAILNALTAANLRGEAVHRLYAAFLADPDSQVRQAALTGLEQLDGADNPEFLRLAQSMVADPDAEVRAQVLPVLLRSPNLDYRLQARNVLDTLLYHSEAGQRARGLQILNRVGSIRFTEILVRALDDLADEVRLEAVLGLETLSDQKLTPDLAQSILPRIRARLHDPVERVRQAALVILGRLDTYKIHPDLVEALADASPQVRETAATVLTQLGKAAIPAVYPKLDSPDPQLRKMAAVMLARINRSEFGALIKTNVTGNLLTIYTNYSHLESLTTYQKYRSITVLQSALREQNQQLLDEIFYLLAAIHDPKAIKTITDSLRSREARVRANAAEAFESLTSPETARLTAPLFEPDLSPAQLLRFGQDAWEIPPPYPPTAVKNLLADSSPPWLRAIMTFALGEIGADLRPAASSPPLAAEVNPRPRRARPADLFGALLDTPSAETGAKPVSPGAEEAKPAASAAMLTPLEIEALLTTLSADPLPNVRQAAQTAQRMMRGQYILAPKEANVLSIIEKIIFLKEVSFFQSMTVNQLEVLATVCEEDFFAADTHIFNQEEPGGTLYVIVNGQVGIEREGTRKGSYARLATLSAHAYFGEMSLFDSSPRSALAVALQDTLVLSLRREPLIALARQYPDLSLELIHILSQRLREANDQIAQLTRARPRELQKLFDQLG